MKKMPINVIGNSSCYYEKSKKIDTSLFVQKPYLRTNYLESKFEEDIDMKIQFRNTNLPDLLSILEESFKVLCW